MFDLPANSLPEGQPVEVNPDLFVLFFWDVLKDAKLAEGGS